jgi:hypothetical protein
MRAVLGFLVDSLVPVSTIFFGNFYGFPKSVVALYSETLTSQEGYTHSLKDTKGTHSTQIRGIYIDGW